MIIFEKILGFFTLAQNSFLGQPNTPLYKSDLRLDVGKSYKLWALEGESC
jgi:hypothetical protein